jgi:hypothetical protein
MDMSGYIDPIAIFLKFCRGLNAMMQDRIIKSGIDRPRDNNFDSWFKAAHQLYLNHLANEAFHYALRLSEEIRLSMRGSRAPRGDLDCHN